MLKKSVVLLVLAGALGACNFDKFENGNYSVTVYTTYPDRTYAFECVSKGHFFRVMTGTSGTVNLNVFAPDHPVYSVTFNNLNTSTALVNNCINDTLGIQWEAVSAHFAANALPPEVQGNPDGWFVKVQSYASGITYQILDTTDNSRMELLDSGERECIEARSETDLYERWAACETQTSPVATRVIAITSTVLNEFRFMAGQTSTYYVGGVQYYDTHANLTCPNGTQFDTNFAYSFYGTGCSAPRN